MKLREILFEQAPAKIDMSDLKFIYDALHEKVQPRLERYVNTINKALETDEIVNPEYQDLKSGINSIFYSTFEKLVYDPFYYAGAYEKLPKEDVYHELGNRPELHTFGSIRKRLAKVKTRHEVVGVIEKYLKTAQPLVDAMAYLKTKIVKKVRAQVEKEEKEITYREKVSTHEDVKRIRDLLTQITKDVYEEALEANVRWFERIGENIIQKVKENPGASNYKLFQDPFMRSLADKIFDDNKTLEKNYKDRLKKEAKKVTDDMMNMFVEKNTSKLSEIVSRKNNMKSATVVNATTSRGVVEGILKLVFNDNSHFTVDNKVVTSYSKYGKWFHRFPTTFHNVVMPDSSKMSKPSEERMIEIFAAK